LPLPFALHAEQFLVINALQHGEEQLTQMAVSHAPCGHCRQFMCEMQGSESLDIQIVDKKKRMHLPDLLPLGFTPTDLLGDSAKFLFEKHDNDLAWSESASSTLVNLGDPIIQQMADLAFDEANSAYAPYSDCPSAACILDKNGQLYSGCVIESAAYNPSVSPLHSALVNGLINGLTGWDQIDRVVLVEREKAPVRHDRVISEILRLICPLAEYHQLHVH